MPIKFICPNCGYQFVAPNGHEDLDLLCPKCNAELVLDKGCRGCGS